MPYQLLRHAKYIEVRYRGVLDTAIALSAEELGAITEVKRVLLDFTAVTAIDADVYTLAEQARRTEERGLRVAFLAPRPALFGVTRQVLQLAAVNEGQTANVFSRAEDARAWLLSG